MSNAPLIDTGKEKPEDVISRISGYIAEMYPKVSPAEALAGALDSERKTWLSTLSEAEQNALEYSWDFWARPKQREPKKKYKVWIIMSGRGFGKSMTAAQTVRSWIESGEKKHIALVGDTAADIRDTMIEAVYKQGSGLMQICPPWNMPVYSPTKKTLTWTNPNYKSYGAVCSLYSADAPDQLRGPSHDGAWIDEWAKMRYGDTVWHMLKFTLRRGENPQTVISTTPKPVQFLIDMLKQAEESQADGTNDILVTRGSTYENRANLASDFLKDIAQMYEGTTLGRQEIYADLILQADGALWTPGLIEMNRVRELPSLKQIVIAVDPQTGYRIKVNPTTGRVDHDVQVKKLRTIAKGTMTGIVTIGLGIPVRGQPLHAYVLRDDSINGRPEEWAAKVATIYKIFAPRYPTQVVAESNQGGEMIRSVINTVDPTIRVRLVSAQTKKHERAIPVVAKYEQGRVHHHGTFPLLEAEQCLYEPGDEDDKLSPNRMDALVWGVRHLLVDGLRAGAGIAISRRV